MKGKRRGKEGSWASLAEEDKRQKWIRGGEREVASEEGLEVVGAVLKRDMGKLGEVREEEIKEE